MFCSGLVGSKLSESDRQNYLFGGSRRPICKEYSSGGNCVGASGYPGKRPTLNTEFAFIPPCTRGSNTVYISNCTDEPLELEFRNRPHRITPPLEPGKTTPVTIIEYAPIELGQVKTVRVLPGMRGRRSHQYKTNWFMLNAGTSYNISFYEDRLVVDDKIDARR